MKKLIGVFLAAVMMFSIVFISEAISSNSPFSAQAQVTVKKKRVGGVVGKTYRGGKYVVRKTWNGTKYVSKKVWVGTKYVGKKTVQGTRYTAHKTKRGAKAITSRTKKILIGQ